MRTLRRTIVALCLWAHISACGNQTIINGPVELTDRWLEIPIADPIEIADRYYLILVHSSKLTFEGHLRPVSPTGKELRIHAELIDMDNKSLPLECTGYVFGLPEGDGISSGPASPGHTDRKFKSLRLRSEVNVTIVRASWTRSFV